MAGPLLVSICPLGKEPFDLQVMDTDLVSDFKRLILEKLELDQKQSLKLIFDTKVLEDPGLCLAAYGIQTGSNVMILLENPGPVVLEASISDRTETDDLRPAARSKELHHPISRIEVSAKTFRDQEWGNCKANLYLTLKAPGDGKSPSVLARRNLYGEYRNGDYPHGPHPPSITFEADDDLVARAEPGCFYQMEYTVGGGGGHKIMVKDWVCKIFYVSSSTTEASDINRFAYGPRDDESFPASLVDSDSEWDWD